MHMIGQLLYINTCDRSFFEFRVSNIQDVYGLLLDCISTTNKLKMIENLIP